jgi:branched-chain amino acid transport system ATP-binding protein
MTGDPLLAVRGLRKAFGGIVVSDSIDLDVSHDEIHALIGPNGAGKTSLVAQIFGELRPDSGTIRLCNEDIMSLPTEQRVRKGLARSFQITSVLPEFNALENVELAVLGCRSNFPPLFRSYGGYSEVSSLVTATIEKVGLAKRAKVPALQLSYGERRHLEIAMALALRPKLLLLDEPMAGVGPEESRKLTLLLQSLRVECGILLIEHDMDVIFALADRITVLVAGRVIASGRPESIKANQDVQRAYFGEAHP